MPILELVNYLLVGEDQPVPNLSREAMEFVIRGQRGEIHLGNIFQQPSAQAVRLIVSAHTPFGWRPDRAGSNDRSAICRSTAIEQRGYTSSDCA